MDKKHLPPEIWVQTTCNSIQYKICYYMYYRETDKSVICIHTYFACERIIVHMLLSFDNMKQFIYDPGMFFIPLFRSIKNYNCMPARYILIIWQWSIQNAPLSPNTWSPYSLKLFWVSNIKILWYSSDNEILKKVKCLSTQRKYKYIQ